MCASEPDKRFLVNTGLHLEKNVHVQVGDDDGQRLGCEFRIGFPPLFSRTCVVGVVVVVVVVAAVVVIVVVVVVVVRSSSNSST